MALKECSRDCRRVPLVLGVPGPGPWRVLLGSLTGVPLRPNTLEEPGKCKEMIEKLGEYQHYQPWW
jgi:hypothetical protein